VGETKRTGKVDPEARIKVRARRGEAKDVWMGERTKILPKPTFGLFNQVVRIFRKVTMTTIKAHLFHHPPTITSRSIVIHNKTPSP
jgi:hypothetical protein